MQKKEATMLPENHLEKNIIRRNLVLIFLLSIIPYLNSMSGALVLDDNQIINETRLGTFNFAKIFTEGYWSEDDRNGYRPVAVASYALNYAIHGVDTVGYHLVNIFIHGLCGIFLYLALKQLTGKDKLSLLAAVMFAVYPIHSEAVASIIGRNESLAALFGFISLYCGWRSVSGGANYGVVSLASFALALLCKENALMFPLILLAGEILYHRESLTRSWFRERMFNYYGYATIVVFAYMAMRYNALDGLLGGTPPDKVDNSLMALAGVSYFMTAIKVVGVNLLNLIAPGSLSTDYSYLQIKPVLSFADGGFLLSLTAIIALIIIALKVRKKVPGLSLGIFIFFVYLLPVSHLFFPGLCTMADRLLYVPSVGICLALAYVLIALMENFPKSRMAVWMLAVILVAFFSYQTYSRSANWESENTLYNAWLKSSPDSAKAHTNYAMTLFSAAKENKGLSEKEFDKVLMAKAKNEYVKALEICPTYRNAYKNLMIVQLWMQEYDEIIITAEKAQSVVGDFPQAYHLRGNAYMKKNDYNKAISDFKTAIDLYIKDNRTPGEHTLCLRDLGDVYYMLGNLTEALPLYRLMFKKNPMNLDNSLYFAEKLLDERNSRKEVQEAWRIAKVIEPNIIRSQSAKKNSHVERCEVVKIKATLLKILDEYKEKKDAGSLETLEKVKKAIDEAIQKYPNNEELQKLKIKANQTVE